MANRVDLDEMPHYEAFHQGLHCLLKKIDLQRKKHNIFLKIITCDPTIYTMDQSDLTVSNFMVMSIGS